MPTWNSWGLFMNIHDTHKKAVTLFLFGVDISWRSGYRAPPVNYEGKLSHSESSKTPEQFKNHESVKHIVALGQSVNQACWLLYNRKILQYENCANLGLRQYRNVHKIRENFLQENISCSTVVFYRELLAFLLKCLLKAPECTILVIHIAVSWHLLNTLLTVWTTENKITF